ncbi:MAG TPA: TraB/GumN family protein [Arenimonas sp.]|nr:TraB/GumN family protein [Arenimonas sp.]
MSRITAHLGSLSGAVLALALCGASPASANPPPRPLLWQACDADNCLYLLGSFHLLTADDYPLAESVDAAFDDSERLLFELSPEDMESPETGMRMAQLARRGDGSSLQSRMPEADWTRLEAFSKARGLPLQQFQALEIWFVALMVNVVEMQRLGLDPALGLDRHMQQRALKAGKTASGLESVDAQLQVFAGMSDVEQLEAMRDTLDTLDRIEQEVRELHTLWRNGDDGALTARFVGNMAEKYPALYRRIQVQRNRAWMPALRAQLDGVRDDNAMAVVGSMHLLGDDGLLAMLRDAGYRVERVN